MATNKLVEKTAIDEFRAGELTLLSGRAPKGKSSPAIALAWRCAKNKKTGVLLFRPGLSMTAQIKRILCGIAGINSSLLDSGKSPRGDLKKLGKAAGVLSDLPIYSTDARELTVAMVAKEARKLRKRNQLGIIIIDGLELMVTGKAGMEKIRQGFEVLAVKYKVPVLGFLE